MGGVVGLLQCAWYLVHPQSSAAGWSVIWLVMTSLYVLSLTAGYQLRKDTALGVQLSKLNHCFQFVTFSINGYAFQYIAGLGLRAGLDLTDGTQLTARFDFSSMYAAIGSDPVVTTLDFNLLAMYCLVVLARMTPDYLSSSTGN